MDLGDFLFAPMDIGVPAFFFDSSYIGRMSQKSQLLLPQICSSIFSFPRSRVRIVMYRQCNPEITAKRQRHLESSLPELMQLSPYHRIAVEEICRLAGIPRGMFCRYFDSKQVIGYIPSASDTARSVSAAHRSWPRNLQSQQMPLRRSI